jgi:hypothetical protein
MGNDGGKDIEDDVKLKNRNMVLNFGEKGDDDDSENLKGAQWQPSSGSGNSTPHGNMMNLNKDLASFGQKKENVTTTTMPTNFEFELDQK